VGIDLFSRLVKGDIAPTEISDDPKFSFSRLIDSMAVRTRFFDDFFTAATDEGVRQAVILASGLDSRAYRLPWPSGTVVFQLDQPAMLEFKTRTLSRLGAKPQTCRRTVAIDLRGD
jgi:methyltransferase (TIGR00027 family)